MPCFDKLSTRSVTEVVAAEILTAIYHLPRL